MGYAGQLHLRCQHLDVLLDDQFAALVDRRRLDRGATAHGDQLPRHDVRVVFHHRGEDRIAGFQPRQRVAVGDHIDRLRGAGGEDQLVARRRVDEARQLVACALVGRGSLFAELMYRTRHIRVVLAIMRIHRLDHRHRFLAGVGVVEIYQRLAVHASCKQRKIRADALDVEDGWGGCGIRHGVFASMWFGARVAPHPYPLPAGERVLRHLPASSITESMGSEAQAFGNCATSMTDRCSRNASFGKSSSTARQNAAVNSARASANGIPRERR